MVIIDRNRCIGCGSCARDCFESRIKVADGKAEYLGKCFECSHCVAVCPTDAIRLDSCPDDVEEYSKETFSVSPENLLRSIKFRRSIRSYADKKVEREKLEMLIEAGRFTATGSNRQDVGYIIVQNLFDDLKPYLWQGLERVADDMINSGTPGLYAFRWKKMCEAHRSDPENNRDGVFFEAPALIVITGDITNAALAASNMELLANTLGLGCLYSGFTRRAIANSVEACDMLGLDEREASLCMLVGYPNVEYLRTVQRRPANARYM